MPLRFERNKAAPNANFTSAPADIAAVRSVPQLLVKETLDPHVLVIGSGFAGLAAADALASAGVDVSVLEARPYWGGHTHSQVVDGFTFDEGPHVSFTKDARIQDLFLRGAGEVNDIEVRLKNYFDGRWLDHPVQCHLFGLEPDLITACIVDFVEARGEQTTPVRTYAEWCRRTFGDTIAERFPFAYTRKYWTVDAEEMTTDWIGERVYAPRIEEVVRGAFEQQGSDRFHYLSRVRYPVRGGYQAFMRGLLRPDLLRLATSVVALDLDKREVELTSGERIPYDWLISTMPLPELVGAVKSHQVPSEVQIAASRLLCTSVVLVNIAVSRPDFLPYHWFYVYDGDISFSRASLPHLLSPFNVPHEMGSIQVEVYHSARRPLDCAPESLPDRVVHELLRMGVLTSQKDVLWARHRDIKYANVVFDHERAAALSVIVPWLRKHDVLLAGRYGEWDYFWTDDSTRSGWKAAGHILRLMSSGRV